MRKRQCRQSGGTIYFSDVPSSLHEDFYVSEEIEAGRETAVSGGSGMHVKHAEELSGRCHHVEPCGNGALNTDALVADGADGDGVACRRVFLVLRLWQDDAAFLLRDVYHRAEWGLSA